MFTVVPTVSVKGIIYIIYVIPGERDAKRRVQRVYDNAMFREILETSYRS